MSLPTETKADSEPVVDQAQASNGTDDKKADDPIKVEGVEEQDRLGIIKQVEFYVSDANLPYDKFMFLQTSPHLDPIKGPTLSTEAKKKAEEYGPGRSPILLQTVASFKRMRQYSEKFPTSKIAQILQTSTTEPKLLEVITENLNGKPTLYIRRLPVLEETNRIGASDRCVYVKGFLSDEDLAKGEPKDIQIKLEDWAKKWGEVSVLRMRRDDPNGRGSKSKSDETNKETKQEKKWKNSVFIEYKAASSAEKLVHEFKEGTEKPKFEGRELSSVMFKIDYVTMKATEKGLPPPKMSGSRKADAPTKSALGALGGNNSSFNAFKEMKAVADGRKEYASGPFTKSGGEKSTKESKEENVLEIEYEGNKLEINKDGTLKDVSQLKNLPENVALGFDLKGDKPEDFKEARVNFRELKETLTEGEFVCEFVTINQDGRSSGFVGFNKPVDDERFAKLKEKEIKSGGRIAELRRLNNDENKNYHVEYASQKAKAKAGVQNGHRNNRGNDRGDRGGKRGGGGGGRGQKGGRRDGGKFDRNSEKVKAQKDQSSKSEPTKADTSNESNPKSTTTATNKKRDAEGNIIGSNGAGPVSTGSVPEISRADKKQKVEG